MNQVHPDARETGQAPIVLIGARPTFVGGGMTTIQHACFQNSPDARAGVACSLYLVGRFFPENERNSFRSTMCVEATALWSPVWRLEPAWPCPRPSPVARGSFTGWQGCPQQPPHSATGLADGSIRPPVGCSRGTAGSGVCAVADPEPGGPTTTRPARPLPVSNR